ncbi:MAG TPA: hypothetical protein VN549_09150 [Negativicutes bacterium]|nr:hypothetical protein [Negativicutes bacterium]
MKDQLTMSCINLHALLQNMEELVAMDRESAVLVKDASMSIQFSVKGGPAALLSFEKGRCRHLGCKGANDISLYFSSPEHLNKMFDGKANPIPLKGLGKIGFLKNEFTKLTERLAYYLKPTEELLKDSAYLRTNTVLTAYTAFFALAEIGNNDRIGRLNAGRIPDGVINVTVKDGPALHLSVKGGHIEAAKGAYEKPRAIMEFSGIEVANAMLNGKVDAYTCIASGDVSLRGYIPMLDNLNKLLAQVPEYLK